MVDRADGDILFQKKLLAAVTLEDADSALSVSEAFLKGGLNVMEITFRTSATAEAIRAIAEKFPEMHIGAGTILSEDDLLAAKGAGAQFGLSPGFNPKIAEKAKANNFPFIPGVMTPSEIELALDAGYKVLKLFPATDAGGVEYIQSLVGPYRHTGVKFLVMGGVNPSNLRSYLQNEIVIAGGGSWLSPFDLIRQQKYSQITEIVQKSLALADRV